MNFRGAIFDADGTLIDSMPMWRSLGRRYLQSLDIISERGLDARLYAMSFDEGCEYLSTHYGLIDVKAGIFAMIERFYRYDVLLKPGINEYLEKLRQHNIPMVIATVGDRELLTSALIRTGIDKYFREIFTGSELNTTKHEPLIYLECARYLGLEPENIAVFEDALYAVRTAKEAGFITFGVRDGSNLHDTDEIQRTADYYIERWKS